MTLLEPYNLPFAAALALMALLAFVQLIGLGDMLGGDADLDLDADADGTVHAGAMDGLFSLIGLGRLPLTIWLALYLLMFAGIGVSLQAFAASLAGAPLDRWLAAIISGAAALPVTGIFARPLGAIMPKDETSAVSQASLVGRRATITDGIARTGSPARARVRDIHGQTHHVMVEPHETTAALHAGDEVLLVRREGQLFYATALAERRLSPTTI